MGSDCINPDHWLFIYLGTLFPKFPTIFVGKPGGAKVLGKLPVPGPPTTLDYSRARAYCACSRSYCAFSRCRCGLFGHFSLIYHFSFLSPSLWQTARYRLKYCLKRPLSPKQPTNRPFLYFTI